MSKPYTPPGQLQLNLFPPHEEPRDLPGYLDIDAQVRHLIGEMIRNARKDRYIIAAEMTRATGKDITHHMLNGYTAAKEGNRFPLEFLPAFSAACGSYDLLNFLAIKMGCQILVGDETEAANLGRIEELQEMLKKEKEKVLTRMNQKKRLLEMEGKERR
ncbi:MAG: hypothetical protein HQM06_16645 [Magnetococcales bacterium]|nr:hypothetical protein [Magnetococcales bacterium]